MELPLSRYTQMDRFHESLARDAIKHSITLKFLRVLHHSDEDFDIFRKFSGPRNADTPIRCLHIMEMGNGLYSMRLEAALRSMDEAVTSGKRYITQRARLEDALDQFFISSGSEDIADEKKHTSGIRLFPSDRKFINSYEIKLNRDKMPVIQTDYVDQDTASESDITKICIDKERRDALIRYTIPEPVAELLFNIVSDSITLNKFIKAPVLITKEDQMSSSASAAPTLLKEEETGFSVVTSSSPVDAQLLTGAKSGLYVRLHQAFQELKRTPESKVTPIQSSKGRFLVFSHKGWKAAIGDTEIPISEVGSINTNLVRGRRLVLNLSDSKARAALKEAVKKNYGVEVRIGKDIYIFNIKQSRDGDYFALPEDPDREEEFAFDETELSSGCLFFSIEGGTMAPRLYSIDYVPSGKPEAESTESRGGGLSKDPVNKFEFDEERFANLKADGKGLKSHYKLALKFEVCVFSEFAKLAKKEISDGMSTEQIVKNHIKELINVHNKTSMEKSTMLNLSILYLSMAKAFSAKIGLAYVNTVRKIHAALKQADLTKPSTRPVSVKARKCLEKLKKSADDIMGTGAKRFAPEKEAAIKAYEDIVKSPGSVIAKFMKSHPRVAKILVVHLIASAYSIYLAHQNKNLEEFTTKFVLNF